MSAPEPCENCAVPGALFDIADRAVAPEDINDRVARRLLDVPEDEMQLVLGPIPAGPYWYDTNCNIDDGHGASPWRVYRVWWPHTPARCRETRRRREETRRAS